jgi:DNA-binding response OmpR family regulator
MNNYNVDSASDGKLGFEKAMKMNPDIVICDVLMPRFNGWQTLEAFKKELKLQSVPFVFLTAKATIEDLRKGMNLGADDYLTKPFSTSELLGVITRQLNKVDMVKTKKVNDD